MENELVVYEGNNVVVHKKEDVVIYDVQPIKSNFKYKVATLLLIIGIILFILFTINSPEAPQCSGLY